MRLGCPTRDGWNCISAAVSEVRGTRRVSDNQPGLSAAADGPAFLDKPLESGFECFARVLRLQCAAAQVQVRFVVMPRASITAPAKG